MRSPKSTPPSSGPTHRVSRRARPARRPRGDGHHDPGGRGAAVGKYFFPACSGVAFSNNEFRWSARISRSDGLIRLVPGLGTRAVDRVGDDYPVLIAPGQPNLRANVTVEEVLRYSPRRVDVINLETNSLRNGGCRRTVALLRSALSAECANMVSFVDNDRIEQPVGLMPDFDKQTVVFTFEGLIRKTPFVSLRSRVADRCCRRSWASPVDIEFAYDGNDFYLLQCRPQSYSGDAVPVADSRRSPPEQVIFSANRFVSNGKVPEITHIVYVDLEGYSHLPDQKTMRDIGRAVGPAEQAAAQAAVHPDWSRTLGQPRRHQAGRARHLLRHQQQRHADRGGAAERELRCPTCRSAPISSRTWWKPPSAICRCIPTTGSAFREEFLKNSRNMLEELLPEFAHLSRHVARHRRAARRLTGQILARADERRTR